MCYVCCKELKGWCKSFTRIERLLSLLEAILLILLISFLVFLILHFLACRKQTESTKEIDSERPILAPYPPLSTSTSGTSSTCNTSVASDASSTSGASTTSGASSTTVAISTSTLPPDVECTWEPSQQTFAETHYYLTDRHPSGDNTILIRHTTTESMEIMNKTLKPSDEYDDVAFLEPSDGEPAEDKYKSQVFALVKLIPPADVTFGCILTKISRYWTLTAASCIESIEEVDSLDSFVIMESFGEERAGRVRAVADVRLHPRYAGRARARDLAALRADRPLPGRARPPRLPRLLDYFLVAIGERFLVLGYGGYRTVDSGPGGRRLRQVSVYVVSGAQCGAGDGDGWAPRHLSRGQAAPHGTCGAAPLCAGARFSRGTPCNYCAGAPLLRAGSLLGIMSDNSGCAVACEPQLYVNIATVRDWIDSFID